MNIGIIGLGLIGGSFAKDLKKQINVEVYGYDVDPVHCSLALQLGLVEKIVEFKELKELCDVIILAMPVNQIEQFLPVYLSSIRKNSIIIDLGSTKKGICDAVKDHVNRERFVAAHPLAGTEFSGPEAAIKGLFLDKKNIICEKEKSNKEALIIAENIFDSIGLNTFYMDPEEHDKHLAYVSHLSHVSSFMLGLTVLNIENDEKQIFNLAGTGFASTVRLAKSKPETWGPIFKNNKKYLGLALESYIALLNEFKQSLEADNEKSLFQLMIKANDIRRILK